MNPRLCLLFALIIPATAHGQAELLRFNTLTPQANDRLGQSVSVSGDVMLAGAPGDSVVGATHAGAAYFYGFDGINWDFHQRVISSAPKADGSLGSAVAVAGTVAAIAGTDEVQLFRFNGAAWVQEQLLTFGGFQPDGVPLSVSVDGDVLAVGIQKESGGVGALRVFRENSGVWIQEQLIVAPVLSTLDSFGLSVAVSGERIVVGASTADSPLTPSAGLVFVFRWTGSSWILEQQIHASDGGFYDRFGASVDTDGETLIVGARDVPNPTIGNTGFAYVFRRDGLTWTLEQKLDGSGWSPTGEFGTSVSIDGDVAVVGSKVALYGPASGAAYVYRNEGLGWVDDRLLGAGDGSAFELFGASVSVDGDVIVVGAPQTDSAQFPGIGTGYIFDRSTYPGCAGTDGRLPKLVMQDEMAIGGPVELIFIWNGYPSGASFLAVSANPGSLSLGGGCFLETQPPFLLVGPFPLDSAGGMVAFFSIPANIQPATVTVQGVLTDPGAPSGVTTTGRVDLDLQ